LFLFHVHAHTHARARDIRDRNISIPILIICNHIIKYITILFQINIIFVAFIFLLYKDLIMSL